TQVSIDSLAPGDLVFFSSTGGEIDHVAIYVGGGSIVHAANSKSGICYGSLNWMTPVAACRVV
ncbi:MAG TPA: hydrolase, partial [Lachnospiraceae bacterium]|nr:hydrolase [Lachnospiraceae bacterium]